MLTFCEAVLKVWYNWYFLLFVTFMFWFFIHLRMWKWYLSISKLTLVYIKTRNELKLQFGSTFRLFNYLDCNFSSQGSTYPVVIHDSQQGFEVSPLNSLLSRTFSLQDKKNKNHRNYQWDLWHLNNIILTLWMLNYVDCVPFSFICSLLFTVKLCYV